MGKKSFVCIIFFSSLFDDFHSKENADKDILSMNMSANAPPGGKVSVQIDVALVVAARLVVPACTMKIISGERVRLRSPLSMDCPFSLKLIWFVNILPAHKGQGSIMEYNRYGGGEEPYKKTSRGAINTFSPRCYLD